MYRVKFSEESGALVARIDLPSPDGAVTVKTDIPLAEVKTEVTEWLATHSHDIGDDLALLQKLPHIVKHAAKHRLIRKLHDSVGAWPGGPVTERINQHAAEILTDARGPKGVARQVATRKIIIITNEASRKVPSAAIALSALRRVNQTMEKGDKMSDSTDVGGVWSGLKKAASKVVKTASKTDDIITTNPLARVLVSSVPGGSAALAASDYGKQTLKVIKAAKQGNPAALKSIEELRKEAAAGNQQAKDALAAMKNVNDLSKGKAPKGKGGSSLYLRGVRAGVNPSVWG